MAFTDSHRRCASFGIATNLPDDVIDSIWYILNQDNPDKFLGR